MATYQVHGRVLIEVELFGDEFSADTPQEAIQYAREWATQNVMYDDVTDAELSATPVLEAAGQ